MRSEPLGPVMARYSSDWKAESGRSEPIGCSSRERSTRSGVPSLSVRKLGLAVDAVGLVLVVWWASAAYHAVPRLARMDRPRKETATMSCRVIILRFSSLCCRSSKSSPISVASRYPLRFLRAAGEHAAGAGCGNGGSAFS